MAQAKTIIQVRLTVFIGTAAEQIGDNFKGFQDFYLKAKTGTWP
jgi:hypothetical protein